MGYCVLLSRGSGYAGKTSLKKFEKSFGWISSFAISKRKFFLMLKKFEFNYFLCNNLVIASNCDS